MSMPERERSTFIFPRVFGAMLVPPMLADLLGIIERFKPDLLIHEAAEFAAPIAAAKAGLPSLTHSLGGIMPPERLTAVGDQLAGIWQGLGLEPLPYAGSYTDLYLDIYPASLRRNGLEHVPLVQPLRPVPFASRGTEPMPSWPAHLVAYPLVYVTFGTAPQSATAPAAAVIDALSNLPVRGLVTLGHSGDPAAFGEPPANVHINRYIPQTEILGDCAVVVSHTGSGTFLAALGHGLPQLCLPHAADQFENAEACERVGAGIMLEGGAITTEAVRGAIERLLDDPGFASAAARVREEIAARPDPAIVAEAIARRYVTAG
jgi:UDP-glucoronosyl and UDP-glucosyl transferase